MLNIWTILNGLTPNCTGTRPGGLSDYFVSHIREELDAANEFFLDRRTAELFYIFNSSSSGGTSTTPPASGFVFTRLRTLLSLNGTAAAPVTNVTISGLGFRDARATYMDPHVRPPGKRFFL